MGAVKKYDYPKYVWSPAGGWWCNPPNWRRNTAIAGLVTVAIITPLWMLSNRLERSYTQSYPERVKSWKQ